MMKSLKFLVFVVLALSLDVACSGDKLAEEGAEQEITLPEEKTEWTAIKWKLTSFVSNGNAKTPEPNSSNHYWLILKNDNTLEGRSSENELAGSYEANTQTSSLLITSLGGTKIGEGLDGNFFVESLKAVRSFEFQEAALKLYYNETDYLLFNIYDEKESTLLTGTKWKLAGIRNLATGELRTLESHNRFENECFFFTFETDTTGFGRSCTNLIGVNIKGTNGHYLNIMTLVYEGTDDCIYFSDILYLIDECFFEKDRLIFAYTQGNVRYHLQFKQVKE